MNKINVFGAGLAGCEAAWQAARRGTHVTLYEMKPNKKSPAHHSDGFCELVCSNSLRSAELTNGVGLLKEELSRMGSLVMEAAYKTRVSAGGALAVSSGLVGVGVAHLYDSRWPLAIKKLCMYSKSVLGLHDFLSILISSV